MIRFILRTANFLFGRTIQKAHAALSGSLRYLTRPRQIDRNYFDYFRLSMLELVSSEINNSKVEGNVAELGVYQGKFARYINKFFPNRTCYLFDTFEGFDPRDTAIEQEKSLSSGKQNFSDTSVQAVLRRMPHPEKCVPVKGFFPDSAVGLEDRFVFVSLDADLFEPIYQGLLFFYPRLTRGGYIFIHDFNNENYKGARTAVEQFCSEMQVPFIPLPDECGSAVISK
jgi:O-methyltransferase